MTRVSSTKIVLIGSGNVATHLAKALCNAPGYPIAQIISRTRDHAKVLANKLNCIYSDDFNHILPKATLYLIAVSDNQIPTVLDQLQHKISADSFIAHTSGSAGIKHFEGNWKNYGVLYPLQTFSKHKKMVYSTIPIYVCASSNKVSNKLMEVGKHISSCTRVIDEEDLIWLHVCAVLVNNFPNALYRLADEILKHRKLDFKDLLPLIEETTHKLKSLSPAEAQTGPARRGDSAIIAKHMLLLQSLNPGYAPVYEILSELISSQSK